MPLSARGEQTCAYLYKKGGEKFALLERKAKKVTKHLLVFRFMWEVVCLSLQKRKSWGDGQKKGSVIILYQKLFKLVSERERGVEY